MVMATKINNRMTGKDYRKEYDEMMKTEKSLISHTKARLKELLKKYPDSTVSKVSRLKATDVDDFWVETMSTVLRISFIESIEEWSEEQQGVQQLKI